MKSKYMLMSESLTTDEFGNHYPDLATFKINDFQPTSRGVDYQLTFNDCLWFYKLVYEFYSDFNFYDDITLWLNEVPWISDTRQVDDVELGTVDYGGNFERFIKFYSKQDIDRWLLNSI
ncbi:MAG: hypothetical protein AB7V16_07420 [Vulcanibacillus sp.]